MIEIVKQAIERLRKMEQTRALLSQTLYNLDSWIRGLLFSENSDILNHAEKIVAQDFYIATLFQNRKRYDNFKEIARRR